MSPQLNAGNMRRGLRSVGDLTQHLTTRADDSHAPPVNLPRREAVFPRRSGTCQTQVRFFALRRIKPHAPLLVRVSRVRTYSGSLDGRLCSFVYGTVALFGARFHTLR